MDIKGSVAVLVGGASGMGRACAEALAAGGATVAVVDRERSAGAEVAAALGGPATFHAVDALDADAVAATVQAVADAHGRIDIAVNTVGGGIVQRTLAKDGPHPLDAFRNVIELNLVSTFNLNRLQAWHMSRNEPNADGERGVIVNTSSIAAFEGQIGQVAYTAAKAGIAAMGFTMARDLGSLGIRVNAIAPSLFATGLTAGISADLEASLTRDAAFPRRMGRPEEFARLAVAIVENPMLNGGCLRLDGAQRFAPSPKG